MNPAGNTEATQPAHRGPVVACVKWVDLRPDIDAVHGAVSPSERGGGFSAADRSAVEVALRLAEAWGCEAEIICAGPADADRGLLELAGSGARRALRLDQSQGLPSETVAEVIASVLGRGDVDARAVVCGDLSYDRGSGVVPALLAHHLGFAQALGLIDVTPGGTGEATVVRRLDGARREILQVRGPAVYSVEGGVATLRRASLAGSLGSNGSAPTLESRRGRIESHVEPPRTRPWRPRARVLPPPEGDTALDRIVALTGTATDSSPPRSVEAGPAEAAAMILEQLRDWGYLGGTDEPAQPDQHSGADQLPGVDQTPGTA